MNSLISKIYVGSNDIESFSFTLLNYYSALFILHLVQAVHSLLLFFHSILTAYLAILAKSHLLLTLLHTEKPGLLHFFVIFFPLKGCLASIQRGHQERVWQLLYS